MRIKKPLMYLGVFTILILLGLLIYYYVDLVRKTTSDSSLGSNDNTTPRQAASRDCSSKNFRNDEDEFEYVEGMAKEIGFDRSNALYMYYVVSMGPDDKCRGLYWPDNEGNITFVYQKRNRQYVKTPVENLPSLTPIEEIRMPGTNETTSTQN